jgi:L-seryl-tRNA(Ser) seleniumtransferase
LGRAPLAPSAIQAIVEVAGGYSSVEVDVESGQRSQRIGDAERLLKKLTGAEAAAVVNNNAGATLLALSALATGREVIVSRGQLVEIGGSYRLPDVMELSGARLREVGTTNKTRIADYQHAIGPDTGGLMRVHTSNYAIVGFTEETPLDELVALGKAHHLPVIDDIGSGAMQDLSKYGVPDEPVASASIRAGADVVLFSGDKLLGGPQCGIIVGKKELVQKIIRHPLTRAMRCDKLVLAALVETLRLHRDPETAENSVPLLMLLSVSLANLENRAQRLAPQLAACPAIGSAEAIESTTFLGGGSVPSQQIPTWCVALTAASDSLDALARKLRCGSTPVFGRIQRDRLMLDLRTVFAKDDLRIVEAVQRLAPDDEDPAVEAIAPTSETTPETSEET